MADALKHTQVFRFDQMAVQVKDKVDPAEADVDRYVGLEHIDPESLKIRRWGETSEVESSKIIFKSGDIIFGKRRAYQRKLAVADFDGICSAHAMVLRPKTDVVLKEFLPFFMQSDIFMDRAVKISVGGLSPTINWRDLAKEEFALPPLEEQRRMAEVLRACEQSVANLFNLMQASETALCSACIEFGTSLLADETLPLRTVDSAGDIRMGRQRAPKYQTGKFTAPYLRVANVYDGYITTDDVLEMDFNAADFAKYQLRPGDVLLNEGQSRELVGRCAVYRGEIPRCCFQNTLIRFRSDEVLPEFAQSFFRFMLYSGRFAALSRQTSSMAHLGLSRFRSAPIRVPGLEDQASRIAHIVALEQTLGRVHGRLDEIRRVKATLIDNCVLED